MFSYILGLFWWPKMSFRGKKNKDKTIGCDQSYFAAFIWGELCLQP